MRKRFTLTIASLAFLLGSSVAWGQQGVGVLLPEYQEHNHEAHEHVDGESCSGTHEHSATVTDAMYIKDDYILASGTRGFGKVSGNNNNLHSETENSTKQVTPRRGDADTPNNIGYINTSDNVNNEFGAGETATITSGSVTWPAGNGMNNPPASIQLGSEYSQNIVINTYNAGGYASEWLSITVNKVVSGSLGPWAPFSKGTPISHRNPDNIPMTNPWGSSELTATSAEITNAGLYTKDVSERDQTFGELDGIFAVKAQAIDNDYDSYTDKTVQLYVVNHLSTNVHHWQVKATTTKLPYTVLLNTSTSTDDGVGLVQVAGSELISLGANPGEAPGTGSSPINNYIRPTTIAVTNTNTFNHILFKNLGWWYQAHNIGEFTSGVYFQSGGATAYPDLRGTCGHISGNPSVEITAIKGWGRTKLQGTNYLDAAVQLINGAKVCVNTDVMDQTSNIGTKAQTDDASYQKTNALVVLPVADRVTFRTGGNFQVNMHHERTLSTADNVKYGAANFPDPDTDIYLYAGALTENIGRAMKNFANPQYTTVTTTAPYTQTESSIFGVNGDYLYTGNMADIHTDSTTFANNNPGVIEVGSTTAGKSHFHIYANGMLKNYEGCNLSTNIPMHFGHKQGGTPGLLINTDNTLYIANFGNTGTNNCDADLLFHTTSVDSINNAFTDNGGAGALHIQALSDVRLRGNGTWNAAANGNNIYVLSDGGNISTQKLDITSDNTGGAGHGLVTFWAETDALTDGCVTNNEATRFSESGNIYFNDAVTLTRAAVATTQTNIIAANNIRTAAFTSTNANDEDTTNIISRKGDIYLGYSADVNVYNDNDDNSIRNGRTGNENIFSYKGTGASGTLNILSGYDDQTNTNQSGGGNIYFTRLNADMTLNKTHETNITIPFSNEYYCGSAWVTGQLHERLTNGTMKFYEHAGIIGGVGRCGTDAGFADYAGLLEHAGSSNALAVADTSLIYRANAGNLLVDAGLRGNIIMNQGSYLNFQDNAANGFFLTRSGDIDMRGQTNIDGLDGSVLFLASSELPNKWQTGICGCLEQQNNVYLQDLQQRLSSSTTGSIYIGADNNIKLQYGGLKNIGTQIDPFLSENKGYDGVTCGTNYHCDSDTAENRARDLILNFARQNGAGGMGIVASDLIDIYKNVIYTGGNGSGMAAVPTYGNLHGESVAGYGLYIKSQANKKNWTKTDFDILDKCGRTCAIDACTDAFLHQTARVTFHADARLYPENQRVYIGSPVLDIYGYTELNTTRNKGAKTSILIQTDSLIVHDSLIIDGPKTQLTTWSNLYRNMPIIKLGHQRFTPPFAEDEGVCPTCFEHNKTIGSIDKHTALDSIFVAFRNGASVQRLHTLVADHAVISFHTDSFDHVKGNPVNNAKFYTDTFKVRNHVELFSSPDHTHDGHFELITEEQMSSKDYAGIYARHLHMEPIQPECDLTNYSQLWLQDPALDVITSSTFGGFGTIHADVHVEIEGRLKPGYASLGRDGRCYEQAAGTLRMQDLRLDKGAQIHYSIGHKIGLDGEFTDCIEADQLTMYGSVNIYVEKRACQNYEEGCYPIIRYNSVAIDPSNLNNLKLATKKIDNTLLSLDTSEPGVVYLCVGEVAPPVIRREILLPEVSGATITPAPGEHYVTSQGRFNFKIKFATEPPLKVTTGRIIGGEPEELTGRKNANGEYEYVMYDIRENVTLKIGPEYATSISEIDGTGVWSHNNTIHIRVDKADIASIYSIAGQLVREVELPEGNTSIPMERGVYIVTLKDGSVHKVILR